ncbi:hypothetical protein NE865_01298 [Phthorimaea operculella]|nr:hypothetical protein NE865_01298 [Phthorimaea operculella]
MQPLVSPVDHESRHNSYRAEDETRARNESDNILPPVEAPLRLVSALQWSGVPHVAESASFTARHLVATQTDTPPCHDTPQCASLLHQMQANSSQGLQYNFLVSSNGETYEALGWRRPSPMFPEYPSALVLAFIESSNGETYEALGWRRPSPMFPEYPSALVLAFIGNFTTSPPSRAQLDEARDFIAESVSLGRLHPAYVVVGKTRQATPTQLFRTLRFESATGIWNLYCRRHYQLGFRGSILACEFSKYTLATNAWHGSIYRNNLDNK